MKRNKVILILLIVCGIALLSLVCLLKISMNKEVEDINENKVIDELVAARYDKKQIIPDNFVMLLRVYEGEVKEEEIYKKIYQFVSKYVPEIQLSKKIEEYYKNNTDRIKKEIGITEYDDFKALSKIIKQIDTSSQFENSEFDFNSFEENDGMISLGLKIYYTGKEELNLKFVIYKKIVDGISISLLPKV